MSPFRSVAMHAVNCRGQQQRMGLFLLCHPKQEPQGTSWNGGHARTEMQEPARGAAHAEVCVGASAKGCTRCALREPVAGNALHKSTCIALQMDIHALKSAPAAWDTHVDTSRCLCCCEGCTH